MTATLTTNQKKSLFHEAALKVFPVIQQKNAQSSIIIGLTLFALIILGLFAINPTITTILQLNKQISDDTLVYNQLQEKIANLTTLQGKYEQLQPDLPLVLAALPDSFDLPELLGQIQTLAAQHNVQIISMLSDPLTITAVKPSTTRSVSFSVVVSGTKENVLTFISSFNSFERITTIQKVTLTVNQQTTNAFDATIEGEAFFLPL